MPLSFWASFISSVPLDEHCNLGGDCADGSWVLFALVVAVLQRVVVCTETPGKEGEDSTWVGVLSDGYLPA